MKKKYKIHSDKFKFKVALEALKETKTIAELSQEFKVSASQIYDWKKKLEESGADIFSSKTKNDTTEKELDKLHATIGRLKVECDFLSKALGN